MQNFADPRDYDRINLLAGTITGPSQRLPPPEPKPEPWEVAQDEKNTRRAVAALFNGLFSVIGVGVAVWWAGKTTGWSENLVSGQMQGPKDHKSDILSLIFILLALFYCFPKHLSIAPHFIYLCRFIHGVGRGCAFRFILQQTRTGKRIPIQVSSKEIRSTAETPPKKVWR
jgi:hypothetical protein